MCGIAGATGDEAVLDLLLEGLGRLEYRGYDSAGLALLERGGIWRARAASGTKSLVELSRVSSEESHPALTGIGHTRWATHGRPAEVNSHPHLDCGGRLAVVHNGIIENYLELGEELVAAGHELASETDTEVLAHMIEGGLSEGLSLRDAVARCLERVRGTFALAVVSAEHRGLIVVARSVSPLIVGLGDSKAMVASDIPALLGKVRDLYALEDGQIAEVRPSSLGVTTLSGEAVEPRPLKIDWDLEEAERAGFDDFMLKEMHEQPRAAADTLLGRAQPGGTVRLDEVRLSDDELREVEKVFVVACGSSYHTGMVAKYAIEHWTRLPVEIDIASEFRYRDPVLDDRTLVVGVSQSGETVDTLQAMREAKRWRSKVLVISNVVDSSMAREADAVLYTRAGPEIAVASTKTTLAQVIALESLALYLARLRGTLYGVEAAGLLDALGGIPRQINSCLERSDEVEACASRFEDVHDFFVLGRHVGYPVALEGALKLKEIAYVRAEGYPAGELKHGPIALIQPGTVVIAVATQNPLWEKVMSNVSEVRARGARVVLVANDGDMAASSQADEVLWVPRVSHPLFSPLVDIVPLQLFAYHLAKQKGHEVDRPRNLAKTVTVE